MNLLTQGNCHSYYYKSIKNLLFLKLNLLKFFSLFNYLLHKIKLINILTWQSYLSLHCWDSIFFMIYHKITLTLTFCIRTFIIFIFFEFVFFFIMILWSQMIYYYNINLWIYINIVKNFILLYYVFKKIYLFSFDFKF